MVIAALVFAALAALVHVYIFVLESITWTSTGTRKTFGVGSIEEAETTKLLAFNQGFYNLFLAIVVFAGIAFFIAGDATIGATLIYVGAGSMVAASLVLVLSDRTKASAALKQGLIPLIAVVLLALGLALA